MYLISRYVTQLYTEIKKNGCLEGFVPSVLKILEGTLLNYFSQTQTFLVFYFTGFKILFKFRKRKKILSHAYRLNIHITTKFCIATKYSYRHLKNFMRK